MKQMQARGFFYCGAIPKDLRDLKDSKVLNDAPLKKMNKSWKLLIISQVSLWGKV